jgi:hypothetical protein
MATALGADVARTRERVVSWLGTNQQDYLAEFQKIAEIDTLAQ